MKNAIIVLPRITTKFNHAKHDLIALLEKLIAIDDRGLNMIEEIISMGNRNFEFPQKPTT